MSHRLQKVNLFNAGNFTSAKKDLLIIGSKHKSQDAGFDIEVGTEFFLQNRSMNELFSTMSLTVFPIF